MTLEGARGDALAKQLEAVHFGLDQAASVIAAPFLPDGAAKPLHRAQRFIAGVDAGTVLGPWLAISANWNDRIGAAPSQVR